MKELAETLEKTARAVQGLEGVCEDGVLRVASTRWAEHSLKMYRGNLLRRAIDISIALAEFDNERETPAKETQL